MALLRTRAKDEPPPSEYESARARWRVADAAFQALVMEAEARGLGLSLSRNPNDADSDRCQAAREKAGQFRRLAQRRPEEAVRKLRDLEYELEERAADHRNERELWQAAVRRESNRIGMSLQPAHREACERVALALEQLGEAVEAERQVRAEFARSAPESESAFLPCLDPGIGSLREYGTAPWHWRAKARRLGVI